MQECTASRAELRRTAVKLKGVQYLAMASPKCYVHHADGGCGLTLFAHGVPVHTRRLLALLRLIVELKAGRVARP